MMQYARMGYVIGHEISHGFDNNGRLWNAFGVYQDIMSPQSSQNFNERVKCLVKQYSAYCPYPDLCVNGLQTLGENLADLSGAQAAYRSYKKYVSIHGEEFKSNTLIKELSNEQLFWVFLGQSWCGLETEAGYKRDIASNAHSPSRYRVNGPLSNIKEFADAFKCGANSKMVNKEQCVIW